MDDKDIQLIKLSEAIGEENILLLKEYIDNKIKNEIEKMDHKKSE